MKWLAALLVPLALTACGDPEEAREERVHMLMSSVMQPAAEGIWDHGGFVLTEAGEQSLYPTDKAGWDEVAASAQELIEIAERLKTPEYAPDQGAWLDYSNGVITASEEIVRMAGAQDEEGVFNAGGTLYNACLGCHERYIVEEDEMAGG